MNHRLALLDRGKDDLVTCTRGRCTSSSTGANIHLVTQRSQNRRSSSYASATQRCVFAGCQRSHCSCPLLLVACVRTTTRSAFVDSWAAPGYSDGPLQLLRLRFPRKTAHPHSILHIATTRFSARLRLRCLCCLGVDRIRRLRFTSLEAAILRSTTPALTTLTTIE